MQTLAFAARARSSARLALAPSFPLALAGTWLAIFEQQRALAERERRERGGHAWHRHVARFGVAFDDAVRERRARRARERLVDARLEGLDPALVDRRDARQLERLDLLTRGVLDRPEQAPLARDDEQDRLARAPRPAGAADAVHVGLGVVGDVEVDDVADAIDVEPAGDDVGGDEDVERAAPELVDLALALLLRHVAVHRLGGEAARLELLGELDRRALGAHEDRASPRIGSTSRMRVSASSLSMPPPTIQTR